MSSKSDSDNRSNQLNPNNDAYHSSRGAYGYGDDDEDEGHVIHSPNFHHSIPQATKYAEQTYAFGAVSMRHLVIYCSATFTGIDRFGYRTEVSFRDCLEPFARHVSKFFQAVFEDEELAIFAVFDPTSSCLPWHVPMSADDITQTQGALTLERCAFVDKRLQPMTYPNQSELALHRSLSSDGGRSLDARLTEKAATKIESTPYLAALRESIVPLPPSLGEFEIPQSGTLSHEDERRLIRHFNALKKTMPSARVI